MLVKLVGNAKKIRGYNECLEIMIEQHRDDQELASYCKSIKAETIDDIFAPYNSVYDDVKVPAGFYVTLGFSDEDMLDYADMEVKGITNQRDLYYIRKTRTPHRLALKYGKQWVNKQAEYGFQCMSRYGVCDNPQQIIDYYKPYQKLLLENRNRKFVVLMTPIYRESEEPEGGWRWHKWGPYIGTQKPRHEYLYDDKHIDLVFCYQIYEVEKMKEGVDNNE